MSRRLSVRSRSATTEIFYPDFLCLLLQDSFFALMLVFHANGIASRFTNDVRLFGFLYLFSVFLWNYVAVIVFIVVRGLPSALWLVGGSLVY